MRKVIEKNYEEMEEVEGNVNLETIDLIEIKSNGNSEIISSMEIDKGYSQELKGKDII